MKDFMSIVLCILKTIYIVYKAMKDFMSIVIRIFKTLYIVYKAINVMVSLLKIIYEWKKSFSLDFFSF